MGINAQFPGYFSNLIDDAAKCFAHFPLHVSCEYVLQRFR